MSDRPPRKPATLLQSVGFPPLDGLRSAFPAWVIWVIWVTRGAWHARRRGSFVQRYAPGAPVYHIKAPDPAALGAALYGQCGGRN